MSIFEALADPTRQRILALLREGERPVGDLVDSLGVAQPSVSKHLARLKAAGLVDLRAEAQRRLYRLTPEPLRELDDWLAPYLKGAAAEHEDRVEVEIGENRHGKLVTFEVATSETADEVWAALSEPARLERWLGKAIVQPGVGGRFNASFSSVGRATGGPIRQWAPRRKLEYRWRLGKTPDAPLVLVLFELAYGERGADLVATLSHVPPGQAAELAGLWHAHLEQFAPALRGEAAPVTRERVLALQAAHTARLRAA
jgi:DNA-binding transcriptional ArsR family regulator/uncharacterized protein YndB with AHSA1/START domain